MFMDIDKRKILNNPINNELNLSNRKLISQHPKIVMKNNFILKMIATSRGNARNKRYSSRSHKKTVFKGKPHTVIIKT